MAPIKGQKYKKHKPPRSEFDRMVLRWMKELTGNIREFSIEHKTKINEGRRKHFAFFIPKKSTYKGWGHIWYGNVTYSYELPKTDVKDTNKEIMFGIKLLNIVPMYSKRCKNNHNWKGGVSTLNHAIRDCQRSLDWKRAIFIRDNYTCKYTGYRGKGLQAHHIVPLSVLIKNNNIKTLDDAIMCDELFNIDNGVTVSKQYHKEHHKELHRGVWGE